MVEFLNEIINTSNKTKLEQTEKKEMEGKNERTKLNQNKTIQTIELKEESERRVRPWDSQA